MSGQKSGQQSDEGSGVQAGPEKRKRRNPEQIIANLREIDADLGAGFTIEAIACMMRPPHRLGAPDGAGDSRRATRGYGSARLTMWHARRGGASLRHGGSAIRHGG